MTMKKRITSFALVLLMVLSSLAVLLPVTGVKAAAADESATTPTTKTYKKVTTAPTDWSGTYIIVYENGAEGYAFNGVDAVNGYTTVTIADGEVTAKDTTETLVEFVIAKMETNESEYSIRVKGGTNDGKYIGRSASKNGFEIDDKALSHKITFSNKTATIKSSGGPTLQFYKVKNQMRFRYYASVQQDIALYKYTPAAVEHDKHTYDMDKWSHNTTQHYNKCTYDNCNEGINFADHTMDWVSDDPNEHTGECTVCGYTVKAAHEYKNDFTQIKEDGTNVFVCVCGATKEMTPAEIVDALYALKSRESLDGEYRLTGVVTDTTTNSKGITTITMTVDGRTVACYNITGDEVSSVEVGNIITVTGTLTNYSGTYEFNSGCVLNSRTSLGEHTHVPARDENGNIIYEIGDDSHTMTCTDENCPLASLGGKYSAEHTYGDWKSAGSNGHTHSCTECGKTVTDDHDWVTDTEATDVPDGKLAQKCSVCGEKRTINEPKEVTIDFSAKGYSNQQDMSGNLTFDKFLLTFDKGSNSNAPKYYTDGNAIRMYGGNTLTITGLDKGVIITKITITFSSKSDDGNEIKVDSGNFNAGTWTGSATEVVFTIDGTKGHRKIASLAIEYEEVPVFDNATLDIDKNIDVNFYVSVPNGYDAATLAMLFNFKGEDTTVTGELVNGLYRFTLKDVAPHLMNEKITATLKNGDTVIATLEYSINTYLDDQKKDTTLSDNTKALIESIAAYGNTAADYDNKKNDDTAFDGTVTADPADMTERKPTIDNTLEGFRFKGAAVRMENNIRIRVSFENTSGAELKFFVKVGDGEETEAILSNGYVYTDLIAPSAYDTEYTIIAKNADGETVGTVSLSVNTYVYMVLKAFPANGALTNAEAAMRELAIAIYNYGKAAKTAVGA
ncbi:MAG TPA: hypothetical protein DIW36_08470 [Ruminococcaceae bacterium]|nr:hypothetical protein [Oscillospiraceae bacterium]